MASSVFFKFKSSKEPQRIAFDGTGISVFELKREIITISGLGDGTDFDLAIYNEDSNEEYDDDTTIIPRSTSVVARRLPATKPGHGKAARYVSGKAPVNAKNTHRVETPASKPAVQGKSAPVGIGAADMNSAQTEEEKIAAMFKAGADQWEQQQQQMANAKPVHRSTYKSKPVNVPDHDPPPGYICYRCHEKGHWIQACPTNDDPNFESRPRIKRTTGIPRSFLKTVEKPVAPTNDGLTDNSKQPSGVMVNAEGEYVIAEPDRASWEQFQAKAKASAAQAEAAATGSKELRDRGLECPIDKRMFVEPMKTPCCGKTYCNDCIENALVNSDLVCPNCSKEGVLIDDLVTDEEMVAKIKAFEEEKVAERKAKEASKSPKLGAASPAVSGDDVAKAKPEANGESKSKSKSPSPSQSGPNTPYTVAAKPVTNGTSNSKKRPAEEELKNDRMPAPPTAPAAMRKQQQQQQQQAVPNNLEREFINQMEALGNLPLSNQPFPNANMGMQMSMPQMMGMPQNMMNPMMMQGGAGNWPMYNNYQDMNGMGYPNQNGMMNNMGFQQGGGMYGNFPNNMGQGYQQSWQQGQAGWGGMNMGGMQGSSPQVQNQHQVQQHQQRPPQAPQAPASMQTGNVVKMGVFPNQQRTVFSEPFPNEEDNAYFRKPVNPHRHQNRQRRARPSDYTEL